MERKVGKEQSRSKEKSMSETRKAYVQLRELEIKTEISICCNNKGSREGFVCSGKGILGIQRIPDRGPFDGNTVSIPTREIVSTRTNQKERVVVAHAVRVSDHECATVRMKWHG